MAEAQPQLLSLLEKAANPIKNVQISIDIKGVFAPPQQWKLTDEANPNMFTYQINFINQQFSKGKIQPRKLTQKQLRQQEEKNKKGGKKQAKTQQKPQEQVDEAEEERKRLQWQALSQQQRFHRTQEDPYKAFSLLFENNTTKFQLDQHGITDLQNKIQQNQVEIVLIRKPDMNEEDIAKTKKSKPKNLNIAQLYAAKYIGKVDMNQMVKPGSKNLSQRVKVSFNGEIPEDGIAIDAQNCYIYIQVSTSQPLSPIVQQIKPTVRQLLPDFAVPQKKTCASSIQKLKLQICRGIRAISQQYIQHFSKQKQHQTQQRKNLNLSSISTLRLNEINRKKQGFLNEFINSGKFNTLKERISKSIKAVVIDKFRKQKNYKSIDVGQINKVISELNVFFQEEFMKTIDQFMGWQNTMVHEDLVLGYQNSKHLRTQTIAPIVSQTENQRQKRLATQYQILHLNENAEKNYLNILLLNNQSLQSKQSYARFCLKSKKFDEAYILFSEIAQESNEQSYKLAEAALLINRRRYREALDILSKLIQLPQTKLADKIFYNNLISFIFEIQSNIKESQKYLQIAERYYQMKQNPSLKFKPIPNPYMQPRPKVPKPEHYTSQLTHSQSQQIRLSLINYFSQLNLYSLTKLYLQKIEQSHKKSILEIQVSIFQEDYEGALQKIQSLLKKSDNIRNIDLLLMKADICYRAQKMFESQQVYINILQLKPPQNKSLQIYLKLGYTYIHRKSWQDAQQIFQKACQIKYNCSAAWLGLGIANLNMQKYNQAEQALNLTKIYNPLSEQVDKYQKQVDKYFSDSYKQSYQQPHIL